MPLIPRVPEENEFRRDLMQAIRLAFGERRDEMFTLEKVCAFKISEQCRVAFALGYLTAMEVRSGFDGTRETVA